MIHLVRNIDFGHSNPTYICHECKDWSTTSLTEVAKHVVENQFKVEKVKNG